MIQGELFANREVTKEHAPDVQTEADDSEDGIRISQVIRRISGEKNGENDREPAKEHPLTRFATEDIADGPDKAREGKGAEHHQTELRGGDEPNRRVPSEAEAVHEPVCINFVKGSLPADMGLNRRYAEKAQQEKPMMARPL